MVGKSINVNISLDITDPKIETIVKKLVRKDRLGDFLSSLLVLYSTGYLDKPLSSTEKSDTNSTNDGKREFENSVETYQNLAINSKTVMDALNVLLDIRESTVDILDVLQNNKFVSQTIVEKPIRDSLDNVVGLSSTLERSTKTIQLERPKIKETVMSDDGKVKAFDAGKFAKLKKKK